jgi:trimethylamine--corrinoid protein Co-methyltransferase
MTQVARARPARGGRAGRSDRKVAVRQQPWRLVENPFRPIEVYSADQIEAIHQASLSVLRDQGMRFLTAETRDIMRRAGCRVDEDHRVYFDPDLVMEQIAKAPAQCTLHALNPARSLPIGGRVQNFATVGGPPNVTDVERGKRPGNWEDYVNLLKLTQSLNIVHLHAGYAPEPIDVEVAVRHIRCTEAMLSFSDKAIFAFAHSEERVHDAYELIRLAHGLDDAEMQREPRFYAIINTNSPLQLDPRMAAGTLATVRRRQLLVVTPFTLAGAMAPVTLPGALTLQNAEALAVLTLAQLVSPGCPVVYGGFTSNVDMRSGAPAFGTPEYIKAALAGGQLARRYNLPYRSSNTNASNAPDAQATYEGAMSIWGAIMGGVNLMAHGVGWLEGGLTASYEKYIIDAEMLQTMAAFLTPEVVDAETLALDAIREVGPGGHFFGAQHTLRHYETAFYSPLLSDWRNFEQWTAAGAPDATKRAQGIWRQLLADYELPKLDQGRQEAMKDYAARRTAEGGAPFRD